MSRLTALDTYLASHVLVLTLPSFPDSLLRDLLLDSFPTLVNHARRVLSTVFPSGFTDIPRSAEAPPGVSALLPRVTLSGPRSSRGDVERSFDRARWLWYAGALLGSIAYVAFFTPIRIVLVQDEGKGDGDYGGDEGAEKDDVPPKADDTDNEEDEEEGWTTHG